MPLLFNLDMKMCLSTSYRYYWFL